MATKKITQLPAATAVIGTDLVPIVDDPSGTAVTQKSTWTLVRDFILGISGGIINVPEEVVFEDDVTVEDNLFVEGPIAAETDGMGVSAGALSVRRGTAQVLNVPDNTATTLLTVTCPTGEHLGAVRAWAVATLETSFGPSITTEALVTINRVTGAAVASAITEVAESSVTPQLTFAWTLVNTGASGASNTVELKATIALVANAEQFTVQVYYEFMNLSATGMSIA